MRDNDNVKTHEWALIGIASDVRTYDGRKDFWHEKWECVKCGYRINVGINVDSYDLFNPSNDGPGMWVLEKTCDEEVIEKVMKS